VVVVALTTASAIEAVARMRVPLSYRLSVSVSRTGYRIAVLCSRHL